MEGQDEYGPVPKGEALKLAIQVQKRRVATLSNTIQQCIEFNNMAKRKEAQDERDRCRRRLNELLRADGAFKRDDKSSKGVRWAHQFGEAAIGALVLALLAGPAGAQSAADRAQAREEWKNDRFIERSRQDIDRRHWQGQRDMDRERRDWRERTDEGRRAAPWTGEDRGRTPQTGR